MFPWDASLILKELVAYWARAHLVNYNQSVKSKNKHNGTKGNAEVETQTPH
jgi:hypothetical protein